MKSALALGEEITSGTLDPVELTEQTLEKIETHAFRDRIFTRITEDRALGEAKAARKRQQAGGLLGPLDGVPISWKDLFDTADVATESGSRLLAGRTPEKDCVALENSKNAGLVCVGKTHLSELAFSGLGINPSTATSPNIHGDHLAPGGSSSGAAASVANELVSIGIGSDTGGSVRIPSAWNDLVGFKTTHGLISDEGVVPLCAGFDTAGPLCTSMKDAWLMIAIMAGLPAELPEAKPADQCTFLVNETIMLDDLDTDIQEGFEVAVEALQRAGAKVVRSDIHECNDLLPLGPVLFPYEAWQRWWEVIEAQPDLMFEPIRNRFGSGKDVTREQYELAWAEMMEMRNSFNKRISIYDAILAPTVAIKPPVVAELVKDYGLFSATNMMALRNTRFFNMLGCCVLSLPTTMPAAGLMVSKSGSQDRELASLGLGIEHLVR